MSGNLFNDPRIYKVEIQLKSINQSINILNF